MEKIIKPVEQNILSLLAQYRVLSIPQIATLEDSNKRTIYRRTKNLAQDGFVASMKRSFSGKKGRAETVFSLSSGGVAFLRKKGLINPSISHEKIMWEKDRILEHQLGVNWVLINTILLERHSALKVKFLSSVFPTSPDPSTHKISLIENSASVHQKEEGFFPDAVMVIHHPARKKHVLFFLEYDRGTEALSGNKSSSNTIQQKIDNYKNYFKVSGYKQYGSMFKCSLVGYRLLFVCDSHQRHANLCRLVNDNQPSDFMWITSIESILQHGLGANIWAKGGDSLSPLLSIVGTNNAFVLGS